MKPSAHDAVPQGPRLDARLARAVLFGAAILLVNGCATYVHRDQSGRVAGLAAESWQTAGSSEEIPYDWVASFESSALASLVEEAEHRNFGLEAARYQTRAAEAAARITGAARFPTLGAGLQSGKQKTALAFGGAPVASTTESHTLALSSQWEIDVWNRLGLAYASSVAQYQAAEYELDAFKLSLAGQVAKAWFDAIESQEQWELSRWNAESIESNLRSIERRYQRGLADAFDLRLIRAQAAAIRSNAHASKIQMEAALRALETLLGRYPSGSAELPDELPGLAAPPPAGLPLGLLERRPDLRSQERQLASAAAQEKTTSRNWLPSLAITGSAGALSSEFAELLDDNLSIWSLFADVAIPIFQGGRLEAARDQAEALEGAQLAQLGQSLLQAFREVETALMAEVELTQLRDEAAIAAEESAQAETQAWSLYERGLIDITGVLDAQRRALEAKSQLISIQNRRLKNRVDLHIALGGDFTE